ncbi:DUF2655 domain-containing protein [Enterobacteriaceae bacterium 89]|nr:DUF2655 domain-containing protein [Enterobacteriaceae bacterium 89]
MLTPVITGVAPGDPGLPLSCGLKFRVSTGKDCNPQPANCLKDKYVLRHCCIKNHSDKMGHSVHHLVHTRESTENCIIIPC